MSPLPFKSDQPPETPPPEFVVEDWQTAGEAVGQGALPEEPPTESREVAEPPPEAPETKPASTEDIIKAVCWAERISPERLLVKRPRRENEPLQMVALLALEETTAMEIEISRRLQRVPGTTRVSARRLRTKLEHRPDLARKVESIRRVVRSGEAAALPEVPVAGLQPPERIIAAIRDHLMAVQETASGSRKVGFQPDYPYTLGAILLHRHTNLLVREMPQYLPGHTVGAIPRLLHVTDERLARDSRLLSYATAIERQLGVAWPDDSEPAADSLPTGTAKPPETLPAFAEGPGGPKPDAADHPVEEAAGELREDEQITFVGKADVGTGTTVDAPPVPLEDDERLAAEGEHFNGENLAELDDEQLAPPGPEDREPPAMLQDEQSMSVYAPEDRAVQLARFGRDKAPELLRETYGKDLEGVVRRQIGSDHPLADELLEHLEHRLLGLAYSFDPEEYRNFRAYATPLLKEAATGFIEMRVYTDSLPDLEGETELLVSASEGGEQAVAVLRTHYRRMIVQLAQSLGKGLPEEVIRATADEAFKLAVQHHRPQDSFAIWLFKVTRAEFDQAQAESVPPEEIVIDLEPAEFAERYVHAIFSAKVSSAGRQVTLEEDEPDELQRHWSGLAREWLSPGVSPSLAKSESLIRADFFEKMRRLARRSNKMILVKRHQGVLVRRYADLVSTKPEYASAIERHVWKSVTGHEAPELAAVGQTEESPEATGAGRSAEAGMSQERRLASERIEEDLHVRQQYYYLVDEGTASSRLRSVTIESNENGRVRFRVIGTVAGSPIMIADLKSPYLVSEAELESLRQNPANRAAWLEEAKKHRHDLAEYLEAELCT